MSNPPSFYAAEYKLGKVSYAAYKHMMDAHAYGAAGSITWLKAVVLDLQNCIATGGKLDIDQGQNGLISISDMHTFLDWVKEFFPDVV